MRTRSISVQFYLAIPRGREPVWPDGRYPADVVLQQIQGLPAAKRRVADNLYAERVGSVFGEPPRLLLSVENVELGAELRLARKGAVHTHRFGKDEGPAEPTYVMFLEENVVGLVRLGGGPPPARVASYLGILTEWDLALVPLENPSVMARLKNRDPREIARVRLSTVRGRAASIRQRTKIGEIFEVAERVVPGVEEITLILGVKTREKRARWWGSMKREVQRLADDADVLNDFDAAEVFVERERSVDLLEDLVVWKAPVPADEHRHVSEETMSLAIQTAYSDHRELIRGALRR